MKNALLTPLIVLTLSITAVASSVSDFNGAWVLNLENGQAAKTPVRLSITQQENKLIIINSRSPIKREYVVDGTERQMPNNLGASIIYIAKWEGEALVIDETFGGGTPFGGAKVTTHQEWSIDANRQILTISNSSNDPKKGTTQLYSKDLSH